MDERFKEKVAAKGFSHLTPIQTAVAQPLQAGQSIDALAPTGTGKTLAFTWPLLPTLTAGDGEQVLVLAPSQELAMQTTRVMREWAQLLDLKVLALTGGANVKHQLDRLKKHPEILIGTPGRVAELAAKGKLKLGRLRSLILDEADELLKDETAQQIDQIWDSCQDPAIQVLMFGATPVDLTVASGLFDRDFQRIDAREAQMPVQIKHAFWLTANDQRNKRLRQLASQKHLQAMVFFNTTKQLKVTASFLAHEHVAMATLVRGDSSSTRERALRDFRLGKAKFLLTTDVGARGLDIEALPLVINFDLPSHTDTYTHRAGRTGRMAKTGLVISFGNDHDLRRVRQLVDTQVEVLKGLPRFNEGGKPAPIKAKKTSLPEKAAAKEETSVRPKVNKGNRQTAQISRKTKQGDRQAAPVLSRKERLARIKKAKHKHSKNKGKPLKQR